MQMTIYTKTILFLSSLLFLQGYLFQNLLLAFSGMLLLLFLVYTRMSIKENIGERTVKREILELQQFVNHPVNIKTTLKNEGGTMQLTVEDSLPEDATLIKGENKKTQLVNPADELLLEYQVAFSTRGTHLFTGLAMELRDHWNLFFTQETQPLTTELLVYSDPEEIKKAKQISAREHIEISMPSLIGTETVYEMEGVREYLPGDSLKEIEWKATSRLQKLMTKVFQKENVMNSVIMVDCSRSMRRTTGTKSKIEHATTIAVHLTNILQSLGHPVGLIAYDEFKTLQNVQPTESYKQIYDALTDLPSQIQTSEYTIDNPGENTGGKTENSPENHRFLSTIFPFLAKGTRVLQHPTQASGIYEALRSLMMDSSYKHLVLLTDMETDTQSLITSIRLAQARKYKIWLLTPFSPFYNLDPQQLTIQQLEDMYILQSRREKTLIQLKQLNVEVVELTPDMEGGRIIESIRGKTL